MIREFFRVLLELLTSGYDVELEVSENLEFDLSMEESLNKQEVLLSGTV